MTPTAAVQRNHDEGGRWCAIVKGTCGMIAMYGYPVAISLHAINADGEIGAQTHASVLATSHDVDVGVVVRHRDALNRGETVEDGNKRTLYRLDTDYDGVVPHIIPANVVASQRLAFS